MFDEMSSRFQTSVHDVCFWVEAFWFNSIHNSNDFLGKKLFHWSFLFYHASMIFLEYWDSKTMRNLEIGNSALRTVKYNEFERWEIKIYVWAERNLMAIGDHSGTSPAK